MEVVEFAEAGPEVALVTLVEAGQEFRCDGGVLRSQFVDDFLQQGGGR